MKISRGICLKELNNWVVSEEKLVPKVDLKDTYKQDILSPLSILVCKHILMTRIVAGGPNLL